LRWQSAFGRDERVLPCDGDRLAEWFSKRTPAFLSRIDEAFGTDRRSVTFDSFLKTQVKVKPEPGFPGLLNYGQQIISNPPGYLAAFAQAQSDCYANVSRMLRPGAIIDVGRSDEELASLINRLGADFTVNTQLDISRQDSSHSAAFVLAFAWFLEQLGVPQHLVDMYVLVRRHYAVRSLEPGLFSASISWCLPSGDPFTLLANCFMMQCTIAARYDHGILRSGVSIQKGDDFLVAGVLSPHPDPLPCSNHVIIKRVDGAVAYHAGRFWLRDHFVADPVRVLCRHFARLDDPTVPITELYMSYMSRQTTLTGEDTRILSPALQLMYTGFDAEAVDVSIRVLSALRDERFFKDTCLHPQNPRRVFHNPVDCAGSVARALGLPYRLFRNQDQQGLADLFARFKIPFRLVDNFLATIVTERCVLISKTHVMYVLRGLGDELKGSISKSCHPNPQPSASPSACLPTALLSTSRSDSSTDQKSPASVSSSKAWQLPASGSNLSCPPRVPSASVSFPKTRQRWGRLTAPLHKPTFERSSATDNPLPSVLSSSHLQASYSTSMISKKGSSSPSSVSGAFKMATSTMKNSLQAISTSPSKSRAPARGISSLALTNNHTKNLQAAFSNRFSTLSDSVS